MLAAEFSVRQNRTDMSAIAQAAPAADARHFLIYHWIYGLFIPTHLVKTPGYFR